MVFPQVSFINVLSIGFFGFVFGAFETTTNLIYLVTRNYSLSRRQHGFELPNDVTESEVRIKTTQMFCLGIFVLVIATISLLVNPLFFILASGALCVSSLIDYLRFRKSGIMVMWLILSSIPLLLLLMDRVS